eukprot:jgi/Botrbrau1/3134/Bobra.0070s0106.1
MPNQMTNIGVLCHIFGWRSQRLSTDSLRRVPSKATHSNALHVAKREGQSVSICASLFPVEIVQPVLTPVLVCARTFAPEPGPWTADYLSHAFITCEEGASRPPEEAGSTPPSSPPSAPQSPSSPAPEAVFPPVPSSSASAPVTLLSGPAPAPAVLSLGVSSAPVSLVYSLGSDLAAAGYGDLVESITAPYIDVTIRNTAS